LDWLAFAAVALMSAGFGLAACYVPIRRATRIEAMDALRHD
jgi:ABC-type lipoprotein release transport system permease subunit